MSQKSEISEGKVKIKDEDFDKLWQWFRIKHRAINMHLDLDDLSYFKGINNDSIYVKSMLYPLEKMVNKSNI